MRRSTRGCAPNLLCGVSTVALSLHKSDGGERTRVGHQRRAVQGSELTGPVRPYGSAHFGPGLAMDTNCPD
jgi:hypothetical protein